MDFHQQHGYIRPPAPPPPVSMAADPYYHHHQGQIPPVPPPNQWYSNQFHFQHPASSTQQPPPPPPHHVQQPPHQQWAPAPQHPDQFVPPPNHYPGHPPPPPPAYPAPYPAPSNHYPLPPHHSHAAPRPPRPPPMQVAAPHMSQPYPQVNQEWGQAGWSHQPSWEYQANEEKEDWATKARAWAAYKVASEDQQSHPPAYSFKDGSMVADSSTTLGGQDSSVSSSVHQQEVPSSYSSVAGIEHVAAVPPDYNFVPPPDPAFVYPPVPVMHPAGSQVDPVATVPSPVPGHSTPLFGRMPGTTFQPAISSVAAPFGIVAGPEHHLGAPFSSDPFGVPVASERPKKASVPNWLREEIIKNKPVIVNSAMDIPKEDADSTEDGYGKGDQKSIDSRSTEEEDDDEDDLEAARTAAINNEIKRIVTDVLLQVTAELFDEIATKVLSEDDPLTEESKKATSTPGTGSTATTSIVSLPVKSKGTLTSDANEKLESRGDVLGLGSYASDDDESELESGSPSSKEKNLQQQAISGKDALDNGGSNGKANKVPDNLDSAFGSGRQNAFAVNNTAATTELKDEGAPSNGASGVAELDKLKDDDVPNNLGVKIAGKDGKPVGNHISRKSVEDDDLSQESRDKLDKNDRHGRDRNSSGKNNNVKELEISKDSVHEKRVDKRSSHDEGQVKKERRDDQNGSRESGRDKVVKSAERVKDSDSRKRRSPDYVREGRRERQADSGTVVKEESEGKRGRVKEDKREKPKDRDSNDSSRQNKHHTSISSRERSRRGGGYAYESSDESSDDSKIKLRSRRRRSPSPVRSKKRHVSRSPHSKHSQRRHSPYSSLETSRRKKSRSRSRSRSKSPVRRKR